MQLSKQIIDEIRKIRFGIGLDINNTSEDVRAHIKDNKKFKEDASRLASDSHTENAQIVLRERLRMSAAVRRNRGQRYTKNATEPY